MGLGSSRHAYADTNCDGDQYANSYSATNSDRLADSNIDTNAYCYRYGYFYGHGDCDSDSYGNCHRHGNSHSNGNACTDAHRDSETHAFAENYARTKATGDAPTSAVTGHEHW